MKRTTKTDPAPVLCASCGREMRIVKTWWSTRTCYSFVCTRCGMETPQVGVDRKHPAKKTAEYLARRLYGLALAGMESRQYARQDWGKTGLGEQSFVWKPPKENARAKET